MSHSRARPEVHSPVSVACPVAVSPPCSTIGASCMCHPDVDVLTCLQISNTIMSQSGIPVVHTWNETLPLWDYHRDNGAGLECTHFCFPSAPQLWVHALWQTLSKARGLLTPLPKHKLLPS